MADINKAIKPIESARIAPLNDGTIYQANKEIVFRLGAGLNMFLVNKSYLTFNLKCAGKTFSNFFTADGTADAAITNFYPSYIRNAANIFKTIEISYGGDVIYTTRTHNIEINTIKQTKYGDDYLDANWATYTTTNMVKNGTAYLKLQNASKYGDSSHKKDLVRNEQVIYNIQIPLNQILPIFMDLGSEGFPMRSLNQQIEVRLLIADPYQYLVDWNSTRKDFETNVKVVGSSTSTKWNTEKSISERFANNDITLENVYIYANYYTPEATEAAIIDDKCKNGEYKLKYNTWVLDERQVDSIKSTQTIPASVVTTNTKSILIYCFKKQTSPSVTYKPNINNFQLKIGSFTCPLQPIADSTMITPHEYKFQVDDVFDNIDTYFTSTNSDYNRCYLFEGKTTTGTDMTGTAFEKPSSLFYIFGMNYTSDPTDLGSDSSAWNSQYQMQFNGVSDDELNETSETGPGLQFVIAVNTECGLLIKENNIKTFTL